MAFVSSIFQRCDQSVSPQPLRLGLFSPSMKPKSGKSPLGLKHFSSEHSTDNLTKGQVVMTSSRSFLFLEGICAFPSSPGARIRCWTEILLTSGEIRRKTLCAFLRVQNIWVKITLGRGNNTDSQRNLHPPFSTLSTQKHLLLGYAIIDYFPPTPMLDLHPHG